MHTRCAFYLSMNIRKIPKKIIDRIQAYQYYLKNKDILALNKQVKGSRKGKRCFILGNGPSLGTLDLSKLRDEETFVVNLFWNHPQYKDIRPKNYVLVDADTFPKGDESNGWFEDLINKKNVVESCPETSFFLNIAAKKPIEKRNLYPHNKKYYLILEGNMKDNHKFNIDLEYPIVKAKNVILTCLITAIYMGFEEIILLGCEHDFLAYPSTKHYEGFKHFYKTSYSASNMNDVKHFKLSTGSYEHYINQALILFKNYRLLKEKVSQTHPNVQIFNATPNSFLDVFPLIRFEDIDL